ncbi:MAG: FAD-dependent oxidoreductase [Phycisphaerae bacterium]|nr:FAD-dependent oxidoreductase [Phycisphaerae bacterium]
MWGCLQTWSAILICGVGILGGCSRLAVHPDARVPDTRPVSGGGVAESAREIPVLYDVDVVVVGGSSGAVSAAVSAAEGGARVFLAAPRPYLGEDLCATYRLWLRPDEEPSSPLAAALFAEPEIARTPRNTIPFTYETDVESSSPHKDSAAQEGLRNGKWHSASSQSVQYNSDVNLVVDLGREQAVAKAHVRVYQRPGEFEVADVTVWTSSDKQSWQQLAVVANRKLGAGAFEEAAIDLSAAMDRETRYLKFSVRKTPEAKRVLLGEIILEGPEQDTLRQAYRTPPTPMQVKRLMDDALLNAGVQFLYGCYATDLLRDRNGHVAGIVMANRSGRQAVRAKVVIDATPRAFVARMAGVRFDPVPPGTRTFTRVVIGGGPSDTARVQARQLPTPIYASDGQIYQAIEYSLDLPMKDASFASYAQAEQIARDMTWHLQQVDASEELFEVPQDRIKGCVSQCCDWPGADKVDLGIFRPSRMKRLYVLSGCADVSRRAVEALLRPLELMQVGERIGVAASSEAKAVAPVHDVIVQKRTGEVVAKGDIRDDPAWMRIGRGNATIRADASVLPVLGQYDVVVVGGGTGGAPAGIAAARQGARTLVVEYLHGLGGVGTLGLIGNYYYGYREGFTKELDQGLIALGGEAAGKPGQPWNTQVKIEWYRRELRKAGADIWYGVLGCGAFVEGNQVKGVVVATPEGRGVVLAKTVVDSTGSATIAAAAGAETLYTAGQHIAVQGTGLPYWEPGARYTNTDFAFIDDLDVLDAWQSFLAARKKFADRYDLGQIIDTRERRQILGDFFLSPMDVYLDRTYPDSVVRASSNFDSHGFTIHPMFLLRPPDHKALPCYVPYRCLLPKGIEGVLVTGLGVSAHRDVMPVIRMQPDIQNQGYAAGVAAATAVREGKGLREIDIRQLQRHLVERGNLPAEVLTQSDSFPLPKERVAQAVRTITKDFEGVEVLFTQIEVALPLLRDAYKTASSDQDRLTYAHVLGILGDSTGAETLAQAVASREWDKGWKYTGMGQYGMSMSVVDSLIVALGRTRSDKAMEPIVAKVRQLGPEHEMSHHRAVAMALETLGDPAAAKPLAELLRKPGMAGHAWTDIDAATRDIPASPVDTSTRECSLRELILARALYRCGDCEGLGESILKQYAKDLRGHYARHALAILDEKRE